MDFSSKTIDPIDCLSVADSLDSLIYPTEDDEYSLSRPTTTTSGKRKHKSKLTKLQVIIFDLF